MSSRGHAPAEAEGSEDPPESPGPVHSSCGGSSTPRGPRAHQQHQAGLGCPAQWPWAHAHPWETAVQPLALGSSGLGLPHSPPSWQESSPLRGPEAGRPGWTLVEGTSASCVCVCECVCKCVCVRECVCVCVCLSLWECVCVSVCCHFSCVQLCDPMGYSPPGSSAHRISQARILETVAFFFSRGPSGPRDQTCVSSPPLMHCRQILYLWATGEATIIPYVGVNLMCPWEEVNSGGFYTAVLNLFCYLFVKTHLHSQI